MFRVKLMIVCLALLAPVLSSSPAAGDDALGRTPSPAAGTDALPVHKLKVLKALPHDTTAFTQGLAFAEGRLYEGTGHYGETSIRRINPDDGKVEKMVLQEGMYFGEGIAVLDARIVQLTWRNRTGFVYFLDTMERLDSFRYDGEGWGITFDGTRLIMSDGTSTLRFLNPGTFEEVGSVEVREGYDYVKGLNELEWVDGEVWANIWPTERIVRIDPATGLVTGWISLAGLLSAEERKAGASVPNGIAWDAETGRLFVTGKLWPKLFEVELLASP